ncbi:MAG TPA: NADH-quinone oxidoreductase subunit L [Gemmataceae bacterium]|nr:NADH-quinone oxidoreductase subunit L [Gemmataceae bacterium]
MFDVTYLLPLVVLCPLLGAVLCAAFGEVKELRRFAHWPALVFAALSCVCAVTAAVNVPDYQPRLATAPLSYITFPYQETGADRIDWFAVTTGSGSRLRVELSLTADNLSGVMLLGVTFIGFWIVVFSVGYMKGSPGFPRYFAVVSLFLASMTLLVLADNFILMFAGWEGVGLCSYLLVGYWHHKPSAADAARKAFLVTRLGDVGLILGIGMLWYMQQTFADLTDHSNALDYTVAFHYARQMADQNPAMFTAACLLIFLGCVGKSAQFPLYVWLPDAMEGPTPVSALIHAATMVTAGVYLLARCTPLVALVPGVQVTVACVGAATAFIAGFIALTQTDLKRVLAYSTVSQLGFMFLAVGSGGGGVLQTVAVTAAIFHLFTHAFFKAVLFLSAGSVMHAMHDHIDMRDFSGLRKVLPVTHLTFLCGAVALAGVPIFSGFWSKDMVLEAALRAGESPRFGPVYMVLFGVALVTALMTAFYTFRAYFRTFWGELRMPEGAHPHETWTMNVPLIVLAVGAVAVGVVAEPFTHWFSHYLGAAPILKASDGGRVAEHHLNWPLMGGSAAVALAGVGLAYYLYVVKPAAPAKLASGMGSPYYLSLNRLYMDEIYNVLFVQPLTLLAGLCKLIEAVVFDLVRLVASVPRYLGDVVLRPLQNGLVQFYALAMVMGVAAFVGYLVLFAK